MKLAYLTLAFLLLLTSCASRTVSTQMLYSSKQCREQTASIKLVNNSVELSRVSGLSTAVGQSDQSFDLFKDFDFEHYLAVVVAAGKQRSNGYNIVLSYPESEVKGKTVILPVEFVIPNPSKRSTYQLTTPCMVIGVEKAAYSRIRAGSLEIEVSP